MTLDLFIFRAIIKEGGLGKSINSEWSLGPISWIVTLLGFEDTESMQEVMTFPREL